MFFNALMLNLSLSFPNIVSWRPGENCRRHVYDKQVSIASGSFCRLEPTVCDLYLYSAHSFIFKLLPEILLDVNITFTSVVLNIPFPSVVYHQAA